MKISFVCIWMKTNFHNKNFALSLAFIMMSTATRKWPIEQQSFAESYKIHGNFLHISRVGSWPRVLYSIIFSVKVSVRRIELQALTRPFKDQSQLDVPDVAFISKHGTTPLFHSSRVSDLAKFVPAILPSDDSPMLTSLATVIVTVSGVSFIKTPADTNELLKEARCLMRLR